MKKTVTAGDARKRLGELLEGVYYRDDEVVIERAGKPMAVVIPPARYAAIEAQRERLFQMIREVQERNKDVPDEELERDVERAIAEVRAQYKTRRGKERAGD